MERSFVGLIDTGLDVPKFGAINTTLPRQASILLQIANRKDFKRKGILPISRRLDLCDFNTDPNSKPLKDD